ncbi:MAG: hypothetical protein ACLR67_00215 [Eggerthella lenta]
MGACGAIIVGGPGAIFWMWIIACSAWPPTTPGGRPRRPA